MRLSVSEGTVLGVFAGLVLWAAASTPDSRPSSDVDAREPKPKVLILSGNEKGFIRPCGCTKPALGGVHRRAEAVVALEASHSILGSISLGNLVVEGGRQQQLKFETFLLALSSVNASVLLPGPGEFLLGAEYLANEASKLASFPFLVSNVKLGEARPFAVNHRIEAPRITIWGLVPPMPEVAGVTVEPPLERLPSLLAALPPQDRVIIGWGGLESEIATWATGIPTELQPRCLIVVGGTSDIPRWLEPVAGVKVLSLGSKGRDLVALTLGETWELITKRLAESMPGAPDVNAMLDGYRQAVKDEALAEQWPKTAVPEGFAGDQACRECHLEICEQLDKSGHMRAFATLVATNDEFDPECVRCHVVGFDHVGGYLSPTKTPTLVNVACEACHGPSEAHVQSQAKTPGGKVSPEFCVRCHDPDNSPKFDFKTYWPKIQHPKATAADGTGK